MLARRVQLDIIADRKGKGFEEAAAGAEATARGLDALGDEASQTERRMDRLDREIVKHKALVAALGAEYADVGSKDVFKNLREERGEVRRLTQIRGELAAVRAEEDKVRLAAGTGGGVFQRLFGGIPNHLISEFQRVGAQSGQEFGGGFLQAVGTSIKATAPVSVPIIAASLVALMAEAGAIISGATLGLLGIGGIATGIVAQLQDDRVKAAAGDLGSFIKAEFYTASRGLAEPLLAELPYLKRDLLPIFDDLKKAFDSLRPYISALLDGLAQAGQKFMPGFTRAVEAAGPLLHRLALDLPMLGNAANIFFDELSKGSKGGIEGLHLLLVGVSNFIVGLGFALRILADAFDFILRRADDLSGALFEMADKLSLVSPAGAALALVLKPLHEHLHNLATSADDLGLGMDQFRTGLDDTAGSGAQVNSTIQAVGNRVDWLNRTITTDIELLGSWSNMFDKINGAAIGGEQAAEAMTNAVDALTQSVKQNGTSLDVNTVKGAANRASVLAGIQTAEQAAQAAYDNAVANGRQSSAAAEAKAVYDSYIARLVAAAQAAGFNAQQIWAMINALGALPRNITTTVRTVFLQEGQRPGSVAGLHYAQRYGGVVHAARGLLASGGVATRPVISFAEPGLREAFVPDKGISRDRALGLVATAANWWGADVMPRGGYGLRAAPAGGGGGTNLSVTVQPQMAAGSLERALAQIVGEMLRTGQLQLAVSNSGRVVPA